MNTVHPSSPNAHTQHGTDLTGINFRSLFREGFRLPAEWEEHSATWTSWPFDENLWSGKLNEVRGEFAQLVHTIAQHEPVHLLVCDTQAETDARQRLAELGQTQFSIAFHVVELDDVWFRDNGPLFVTRKGTSGEVEVLATKWEFNSWGRKFFWEKDNQAAITVLEQLEAEIALVPVVMEGGSIEQDGNGLALTTKQCLLSTERNPQLNDTQIAEYLKDYLGIERICWLQDGLEGDHTDGHIDTIVRFANPTTILCHTTTDATDPNFHIMRNNKHTLETYAHKNHLHWQIVDLPLPSLRITRDDERLPLTYANYYLCNGAVIVPQYGAKEDNAALEILRKAFPNRKIYPLSAIALITGGGSFHCVTQQQPKGKLIRKGEKW